MTGSNKREHPLSMRLAASDVAIIDRAASLSGRSRTDFVREAAVRAAEETIIGQELVRMSPRDFKAFMSAVSAPAKPVPELVDVLGRKEPWRAGGSARDDR